MSGEVKCRSCGKRIEASSDSSYFGGNSGYYCLVCGDKIVGKFNELVGGSAGYTTSSEVGVPLDDIRNLLDMLERQEDMCRYVVNDKKRFEIIGSS